MCRAPQLPGISCRSALRAFAAGADVDGRHSGPLAASLVAAAHVRCPDPKPPLLPDAVGDVTALHCAAFVRPLPAPAGIIAAVFPGRKLSASKQHCAGVLS